MRCPQLTNPKVSLHLDTLFEIPQIISGEEADDLVKAIDGQHYRNWCPEGFDRRHRTQRYSSFDPINSHGNSMDEVFGWLYDRIVLHTESHRKELGNDVGSSSSSSSHMMLHRPFEVIAVEHTPSSCHSMVKTFEQNSFCPCHSELSNSSTEQPQSSCNCYIAQLTLMNNAILSIEKPLHRKLECWDLAEPNDQNETLLVMEQNGVVVRRGDCLWNWRRCVSDICDGTFSIEGASSGGEKKKQWVRPEKLIASNKRCIVVTFVGIRQPAIVAPPNDDGKIRIPRQLNLSLPLSQLLTIIVTTSPIRSHPSTQLIEHTFDTFRFAGDEFAYECSKVIVCDGCRVTSEESSSSRNSSSSDLEEKKDDSTATQKKTTKKYSNSKQNLRNGIATIEQVKNYAAFKSRLRKLCNEANLPNTSTRSENPFRNTRVVELKERHGYGFALRHALYHCVTTPYVCVIQHDRTFMRPTPVAEVVSAMRNDPEQKIKYVGLNMRSNLMYYDIFSGKYGRRAVDEFKTMILRPEELCIGDNAFGVDGESAKNLIGYDTEKRREAMESLKETYRGSHQCITHNEWVQSHPQMDGYNQLSLTPTLFWYDNTHIVQTSHYRDFVFNPQYKMVARGGFVEDKLSPCIIRSCERLGLKDGHSKFGCYLLDDHSGAVFTGHLDGGTYGIAGNHWNNGDKGATENVEQNYLGKI